MEETLRTEKGSFFEDMKDRAGPQSRSKVTAGKSNPQEPGGTPDMVVPVVPVPMTLRREDCL